MTLVEESKYLAACEEALKQVQQEHVSEYRRKFKGMSSRERAVMENNVWMAINPRLRTVINNRDKESAKWLYPVLKNGEESAMGIRARARALSQETEGFDVSVAWEYLDNSSTTPRDVRQGLIYAKSKIDVLSFQLNTIGLDHESAKRKQQELFKEALLDFLTSPNKQNLEDAARSAKAEVKSKRSAERPTWRVPKPSTPPAQKTNGHQAPLPEAKPPKPADPPPTEEEDDGEGGDRGVEAKDLWILIQDFVSEKAGEFARARLDGVENNVFIEERLDVLRREMHACYQDFLLGLRQARSRSKDVLEVRRERLRWALETLRIEPRRNWRKEHIDKQAVKKQYRTLSARFHPDSHRGDTRYVTRFNDIQEAYRLLKDALNL